MSFFLSALLGLSLTGQKTWANRGMISRIGDATHLEFQGQKEWVYDIKKSAPNQISILVPKFDSTTEVMLRGWSDEFVKRVEINKSAPDERYEVTFHLSGPDVESFDYLTDEPSRLIVDFYKQTTKTAEVPENAPAPAKKPKKEAKAGQRNEYVDVKGAAGRAPAGSEILEVLTPQDEGSEEVSPFPMRGVFDGGDAHYDRFKIKNYEIKEDSIIAHRQNVYIKFPYLYMPVSELKDMRASSPEYVIHPKDTRENKEARLLMHLRDKKRRGSFEKAYNYFINKYPNSDYDEIVRSLAAEVFFDTYLETKQSKDFDKAINSYRYLKEKYKDSPLAEYNLLLMGYAYLERGEAFSTLQLFDEFNQRFPNSEKRDKIKNSLAQSYLRINKFDEAAKVYDDLMANGMNEASKIEAAYRKGDVYVAQGDLAKAIDTYREALKKYPAQESLYPNAHYNLGESLFWLPRYDDSINHFVQYLERFPSHEYTSYAMTRLGELLEKMGADQSKVMGAFLESYFRFRDSPGAQVARIRMLSQRMKGMKDKELRSSIDEMIKIGQTSPLPRMEEFVNIMVSDGYQKRGDYDKSLKSLITYYQKNPMSTDLGFYKTRILRNISEEIASRVENGNYIDALKFFETYKDTWLRNQNRLDIPFYLARAYEQAGVYPESTKLYGEILNKMEATKGTNEDKERRVYERLPSVDRVRLRLAESSFQEKSFSEAQKLLGEIKNFNDLDDEEKVRMVRLQADVNVERGRLQEAKTTYESLVKSWKGNPKDLTGVHVKLAELYLKTGDSAAAEKSAQDVIALSKSTNVSFEEMRKAYEYKAEAQVKLGRDLAAVETLSELLTQEKPEKPLPNVRFKAGDILYARGDTRAASEVWSGIDKQKNPLLAGIVSEKLEHAQWKKDYRKYLQRIPAMSGTKRE